MVLNDHPLGAPHNPIKIKSIDISPDPPKAGEDLTVTVKGIAHERVEVRTCDNNS